MCVLPGLCFHPLLQAPPRAQGDPGPAEGEAQGQLRPSGVRSASQITASPRNSPARRSQDSHWRVHSSAPPSPRPGRTVQSCSAWAGRSSQRKKQGDESTCSHSAKKCGKPFRRCVHWTPPPGHPMRGGGGEVRSVSQEGRHTVGHDRLGQIGGEAVILPLGQGAGGGQHHQGGVPGIRPG